MAAPAQDMPPTGGFAEPIRYQRYLPKRGPSGLTFFAVTFGICAYGWYWVGQVNHERRELRREKAWARIHLVPLLQAETDRDDYRRILASQAREAAIMKNHPAWKALDLKTPIPGIGKEGARDPAMAEPVYHTKRYVPPNFYFLPKEEKLTEKSPWSRGIYVN